MAQQSQDSGIEDYHKALRLREFTIHSTQEREAECGKVVLPKGNLSALQIEFYTLYLIGLLTHISRQGKTCRFPPPTTQALLDLQKELYVRVPYHTCSASCHFLSFRRHQAFFSTIVNQRMQATGMVFVCLETGMKHVCSETTCNGRFDKKEVRSCPISGFVKRDTQAGVNGDVWTHVSLRLKRNEDTKDWGKSIKDAEEKESWDFNEENDDDEDIGEEQESDFFLCDDYMDDTDETAAAQPVRKKQRRMVPQKSKVFKSKRLTAFAHLCNPNERMELCMMLIDMIKLGWVGKQLQETSQFIRFYAELVLYQWKVLGKVLYGDEEEKLPWEWPKLCRQFAVSMLKMLAEGEFDLNLFPPDNVLRDNLRLEAQSGKHGSKVINSIKSHANRGQLIHLLSLNESYREARRNCSTVLYSKK